MGALPLHELDLLRCWENHGKFERKLRELGLVSDLEQLKTYVHAVGRAWFLLGREHLDDARRALTSGSIRATYSRTYYSSYNISKAVRFLHVGWVSLKGDDHQSVSNLPDDFPDAARWGTQLKALYEHRLKADYDNWTNTVYPLSAEDVVSLATDFHDSAAQYLAQKVGLAL